ncbi:MAG: hypothetical protein QM488_04990 [Rhizobiaceae bacterium]
MSENQKTVLLLGNYRPSLTLARSLQKRGFSVIVSSQGCDKGCEHSKAVSKIWDHSPFGTSPDIFISELREFVSQNTNLEAIYPVAEEYVRLIADNEGGFSIFPNIIAMPAKLVNQCLDKQFMMQLALENGVQTASFASTFCKQEFDAATEKLNFPIVVRPLDSTKRLGGKKALFIDDVSSLSIENSKLKLDQLDLLLQEKFAGKRHNIYFAASQGKLIRCLHAVINRTDSVEDTGLAVDGITLDPHGPLVEQTKCLLAALDYSGIGCAQFLVNEKNCTSSFLEINPRIAGNHALPEYAGLDLGNYMFDWARGNQPDQTSFAGRSGIRYCWASGDLMGTKVAFLRGEIGAFAALSRCLKAIGTAMRADVHMVFDRSDPMPAINALWKVVPRIDRRNPPTEAANNITACHDVTRKLT